MKTHCLLLNKNSGKDKEEIKKMKKQVKKVYYKEFNKAFREIQDKVAEMSKHLPCGHIELYDDTGAYGDFTANIKINWSCCGAESVENTMAFTYALNEVIELVNNFKYKGYEKSYKIIKQKKAREKKENGKDV